ncbi:hypothetical protein ACJZ2D_016070 [Fusarium nematophilum]
MDSKADLRRGGTISTMKSVTFKTHYGLDIAGNEYHPQGFDQNKAYATIIHVSPASGTKEQTAGLYAQRHAEEGFVTIAFDPSFQGESGGELRFQENSIARIEDIRGAADHLVSLPCVDESRIGVLGICAGGGYAASAAITERRISAVGLVIPVNGGERTGQAAEERQPRLCRALRGSGRLKLVEESLRLWSGCPKVIGTRHASTSEKHTTIIARPGLIIPTGRASRCGQRAGFFWIRPSGHHIYEVAASTQKDIMVVEGASHFDMYDQPGYVDRAVARMSAFLKANWCIPKLGGLLEASGSPEIQLKELMY